MRRSGNVLVCALCGCMLAGVVLHAEVRRFEIGSEYLSGPERIVVAWPDGDAPVEGWPSLYLLNGYRDNEEAWPKRTPLDSLANVYSVVIVCPDGRDSFYWDVEDSVRAGLKMESFIVRDLVSHIDSIFPVDTLSRYIAGYRMGGHGALYLTARHPQLFHAAVSLSGALDIAHLKAYPWIKVPSLLGAYDQQTWEGHAVFAHLDSLAAYSPRIMLACGDKDAFLPDNRRLHADLGCRGVEHVFRILPGDHNWKFWRSQLPELLEFVTNKSKNSL